MAVFDQIKKDFMDALEARQESGTSAYDTEAQVVRVDGSTAWVHIPGGVDETPVKMTIHSEPGDTVQVRVSGGSAWLVGNETAPPTDDKTAIEARLKSLEADSKAKTAAEEAQKAWKHADDAEKRATNYIAVDSTGLMVAELNGSGETPSTATTNNVFIDSDSVDVRDGQTVLATFGTETAVYTKNGTELAHFGYGRGNAEEGTAVRPYYTLGRRATAVNVFDSTKTYARGDTVIYEEVPYICVETIETAGEWDASKWANAAIGNWSNAEGYETVASGSTSHAEGQKTVATGIDAHAEGYKTVASGGSAHAEGGTTVASGAGAHAEGVDTVASAGTAHAEGQLTKAKGRSSHAEGASTEASGYASHAEGQLTTASEMMSHAEGYQTTASGYDSHAEGRESVASNEDAHAEGRGSTASGRISHAEGWKTTASGYGSHAEGVQTVASGYASHAAGYGTYATKNYSTVIGYYNEVTETTDDNGNTVYDAGNYLFVIGNGGGDTSRKNAVTVDPGGNAVFKGNVTAGGYALLPVVLYNNDSASLSGARTLSETAANFRKLTICFKSNDGSYGSVDVWNPNGKNVCLAITDMTDANPHIAYHKVKTVKINGTSIDTVKGNTYKTMQLQLGGTYTSTQVDNIGITQVIGYR